MGAAINLCKIRNEGKGFEIFVCWFLNKKLYF